MTTLDPRLLREVILEENGIEIECRVPCADLKLTHVPAPPPPPAMIKSASVLPLASNAVTLDARPPDAPDAKLPFVVEPAAPTVTRRYAVSLGKRMILVMLRPAPPNPAVPPDGAVELPPPAPTTTARTLFEPAGTGIQSSPATLTAAEDSMHRQSYQRW